MNIILQRISYLCVIGVCFVWNVGCALGILTCLSRFTWITSDWREWFGNVLIVGVLLFVQAFSLFQLIVIVRTFQQRFLL